MPILTLPNSFNLDQILEIFGKNLQKSFICFLLLVSRWSLFLLTFWLGLYLDNFVLILFWEKPPSALQASYPLMNYYNNLHWPFVKIDQSNPLASLV